MSVNSNAYMYIQEYSYSSYYSICLQSTTELTMTSQMLLLSVNFVLLARLIGQPPFWFLMFDC